MGVTDDHQIHSVGLTERTAHNEERVGDASPNTASAVLCNPAKNYLLANRKEGLKPNPKNGFQVIVSYACLGFARMCFTTFSHRKITAVT